MNTEGPHIGKLSWTLSALTSLTLCGLELSLRVRYECFSRERLEKIARVAANPPFRSRSRSTRRRLARQDREDAHYTHSGSEYLRERDGDSTARRGYAATGPIRIAE